MNSNVTARRGGIRNAAFAVVAAATLIASLLAPAPAARADDPLPTGLTQETAAGSCWEIKQKTPAAASGIYWIVTPQLVAPEQFYCDQETDGGGWVLIGRGREGWKEGYNGLRSPADVRNAPVGTPAFAPAQLPSKTVDALLGGGRVDALADGIRVRRATNQAGTTWQEARLGIQARDRWVWTFGAEHRVSSFRFDTSNGSGGQTNNFGLDNNYRRIVFSEQATHTYLNGFAFGSNVGGSTSSSSYLWAPNGQGYARPFAQVYLRPQLTIAGMDFGSIPETGTPATTLPAILQSNAMTTVWGVSGFGNGSAGELNTEVAEFGEAGGRVFVGGNFRYVQRTEAGGSQTEQRFIAAFNVANGEWIDTFRPVLNGQVKAIATLPDGRVAIGGQFSTVNGTPATGLAFLDPTTGALSGAQVIAEHRSTGGVPYIRDLDLQDGFLYVAGSFTHLTKVGTTRTGSSWNGGRINLTTGNPDTAWNAGLNGTSVAVDASELGDRAYFSGYFKMKGTERATSAAALQTAAGAPLATPAWTPRFSASSTDGNGNVTGNVWQLGITEAGGKVWVGGSEHSLFSYDRTTFASVGGSITNAGGDFQTVEHTTDTVYAGCHCGHWVYQDAYTWRNVGTAWTQADKINLMGAWDANTGKYIPEWSPTVQARAGYGAWGTFVDSTGVLWAGGDFSRSVRTGTTSQWSGGYIRFAPRDATAPTTPGAITATPNGTAIGSPVTLTWGASTDTGGSVVYEVLRGNRVIATTTTASYTATVPATDTTYVVRARDVTGNRSASTTAVTLTPPSETALAFVESGDTWSWRFSADALPADWNTVAFDDSAWATGAAILGRGTAAAVTNIDPTALSPRPLSAQYRSEFEVTDATTVVDGTITVLANDGVVVYVNGVEIGRHRMPAGTVTQNTYASSVVSHAVANNGRVTFAVPYGLLVEGTNVVAASAHSNYRTTPDVSFDLTYSAERGDAPVIPIAPDPVTDLTGLAPTHTTATLTWTAPAAGTAPVSYTITRDAVEVGTVEAPATTFDDTGLAAVTTYEYGVTAVSADDLASTPVTTSVTTPVDPDAPGPASLPVTVANGASWQWRFGTDALPADWATPGFDDSTWSTGAGLFGLNVASQATNINAAAPNPRPLSGQFRLTFEALSAETLADGTVTVIANDGVVLYLNGTELGRHRLPTGTLTQNSYATGTVSHTTAAANRVTFTVPASLIVDGENVLAASVHANYRTTPDLSFDLALTVPRQ